MALHVHCFLWVWLHSAVAMSVCVIEVKLCHVCLSTGCVSLAPGGEFDACIVSYPTWITAHDMRSDALGWFIHVLVCSCA